jgi:predicted nucleic acid-binding protein
LNGVSQCEPCRKTLGPEAQGRIEDEARIGFGDVLIVAAALKAGADRILSEDLNLGKRSQVCGSKTHLSETS